MSIAGHVSRAMLSRYSHVRMEAKAARPRRDRRTPARGRREAPEAKVEQHKQLQASMASLLPVVQ